MINFNMSFDDALAELNASVDIPVVAASGSGSGRFSRPVGNYRKDRLTNIYWSNGLLLCLDKESHLSGIHRM